MEKFAYLVDSIPKNFGAHGTLIHIPSYGPLINNKKAVDYIKNNGEKILGANNVKVLEKPRLDVEDFSYYLKEIPGAFFRLGCRNEKKGIFHDLHDSSFNIDEDCLPIGVAIQLSNIISVLSSES
jgi:metal-dependent amidase/aminoacylase/carboxypeptidase family protein